MNNSTAPSKLTPERIEVELRVIPFQADFFRWLSVYVHIFFNAKYSELDKEGEAFVRDSVQLFNEINSNRLQSLNADNVIAILKKMWKNDLNYLDPPIFDDLE